MHFFTKIEITHKVKCYALFTSGLCGKNLFYIFGAYIFFYFTNQSTLRKKLNNSN